MKNHLNKNKPIIFNKHKITNNKRKNIKLKNEKVDSNSKMIKEVRKIICSKENKIYKIKDNIEIL